MTIPSPSSQDLLEAILHEKRLTADLESSGTLWEASSLSLLRKYHEENEHLLDHFLTLYGWPTPAKFGAEIHEAACLISAQATSRAYNSDS